MHPNKANQEQEIREGNFAISLFMGYTYPDINNKVFEASLDLHNYHEDWNLLMQVVEKIHSTPAIIFDFSISLIPLCRIMYVPKNKEHKIFQSEEKNDISNIEAIWSCVIQFIKWYNITQKDINGI